MKGFELRDDQFESLPMLPTGGIMSPLLRAELRPMVMPQGEQRPAGTYLRVFDAATGQLCPVYDEHVAQAEGRAALEEQARRAAEEQAAQAQERAMTAEVELRERRAALTRQQEQ